MKSALYIVKIGGNIIDHEESLTKFLADFSKIQGPKILIHGGGKIATKIADKLGIQTQMVDGRRITDKAMIEVVTMVYGGFVNKKIVAALQSKNCNAIGLTGADGRVILAQKRAVKEIDYGFVGDILKVNNTFISNLLAQDITPVFAPLTYDALGNILNTNADTQAAAVAVAMTQHYEVNLIYCFEKKGVLMDIEDENSVITNLRPETYVEYKSNGLIFEGMIPKLDNAFEAIKAGVKKVIIGHADQIIDAVQMNGTAGTTISN